MIRNIKKIVGLGILFCIIWLGYSVIPVYASENAIDYIVLRCTGDTTNTDHACEKLSNNVFLSEEDLNISIGSLRIFLNNQENYEIKRVYNSFAEAGRINHNKNNPSLWTASYTVASYDVNSFGAQTFYIEIQNIINNTTETYTVVSKHSETVTRDGAYLLSSKAELLNSSLSEYEGTSIEYSENQAQVKKVEDYSDTNSYIRLIRPHEPYTIYTKNTQADWIKPDANYYRVNGSDIIQFNSSSDNDNTITSGPVHLNTGWNVIECYSRTGIPYFGETAGLEEGQFSVFSSVIDEFVWLINYTGEEQDPIVSNNTSIKNIRAVNYVYKYQETFAEYSSVADPANDDYVINLPVTMQYPYILLQVTPDDEGATVTMPEDMVRSSYGPIYSMAVTPNETQSIPVTVTASDGTSKVQDIRLNWLSSDCSIDDIIITNGQLDDELNPDDTSYLVTVSGEGDIIYKVKPSEGATVRFDGTEGTLEDGYYIYSSSPSDSKVKVVVTAEDGITKKTYTFVNNTIATYFGVSDSTKAKAQSYLDKTDWYTSNSNIITGRYWDVFMRAAVGRSFDGTQVYDVTTATIDSTAPAKTYGAIILDLVITGENPYDFNGTNYVELLENCGESYGHQSFGPYGADIWAYIGLKAAGAEKDYPYMSDLTARVKNYAMDSTATLEMRAWAWAALGDELSKKQKIQLVEEVRENFLWTRDEDAGLFVAPEYQNSINSNCHGCVMTGLNSMDYDVESYQLDETHSPLITLDSRFYDNGEWLYRVGWVDANDEKDVVIALGEIVTGGSIYNRYAPTNNDLAQLLSTAESVLGTGSKVNNEALQAAYDEALKVASDESGFGKEYFTLYSAVAAIDASKISKPSARMCSQSEGNKIDQVIELISNLKDDYTMDDLQDMSAYNEALDAYNNLAKDYYRSYVTNSDKLLKIGDTLDDLAKVKNVLDLIGNLPDEITIAEKDAVEAAQKAYDELGDLKELITGESAEKLTKAVSDLQIAVVVEKINSLPPADQITLADKGAIAEAQKAYADLSSEQKAQLKEKYADAGTKLEEAETTIARIEEEAKQKEESSTEKPSDTKPADSEQKTDTKPAAPAQMVKKGSKIVVGKYRYVVTNASAKKAAVKFAGAKNKKLTKISIPATVQYKGKTYKVTAIGANACKKYKKLKVVVIGKNVTTIGAKAFNGCKKLSKIKVKTTKLKKVGAKALAGINKKAVIKVPAKKLKKYKKLFNKKGQKKTVKIK